MRGVGAPDVPEILDLREGIPPEDGRLGADGELARWRPCPVWDRERDGRGELIP